MEEKQGELILWVIYASHRSIGKESHLEMSFIYVRNSAEAEEVVYRWRELHPEYLVQEYVPHPEGFTNDGAYIPGKKAI